MWPKEGWLLEGVGWLDLERAYKVYAEREEKPPTLREVYLEVYGVWVLKAGTGSKVPETPDGYSRQERHESFMRG